MNQQFVWDDQPRTIQDILSSAFLPQVVKVHQGADVSNGAPQDLLVLVREVAGRRVLARVVTSDMKKQTDATDKRLALIPAEYEGWFTMELNRSPEQLDTIRSISKVLEIMPRAFLTCTQITCYYELSKPENGADFVKGKIEPNEALTVNSMYEGYIKYSNLKGKVKRRLERFLKVSTSSRKIALLRVKQEGLFYIVDLGKNRHTDTYDAVSVRRVKDILAKNELPVTVFPVGDKLDGKSEKKTKHPTKTKVELLETVPFRAAVACTLHSRGNQLMELPLHTDIQYIRAVQTPPPKHHEALRKTLIFADSHIDKFLNEIKYKPAGDSS